MKQKVVKQSPPRSRQPRDAGRRRPPSSRASVRSLNVALVFNGHDQAASEPDDHSSYIELVAMMREIAKTLRGLGHKAVLVPLGGDLLAFQRRLKRLRPDVVFNQYEDTVPGAFYEMRVAALVRLMGLPITGSPGMALGITKSKYSCACLMSGAGLPIPDQTVQLERPSEVDRRPWTFPLIVRPSCDDGGFGLDRQSVVHSKKELKAKVRELIAEHREALIQEFLPGREFNVGVIGGARPEVLPLAEVDYTQLPSHIPPIMSRAAKWIETSVEYKKTSVICPAVVEPELAQRIRAIALGCFRAVGAWGYVRVDMRLDTSGNPRVLEVNCNPCIESGIGLARSAEQAGIDYPQLIQRILDAAMELHHRDPLLLSPVVVPAATPA